MIKNSIKSHLFNALSILIIITLSIITIISFEITKHEAKEVFDSNLVRTAKLLLNLTKHEVIEHETEDNFIIDLGFAEANKLHKYEYKTHFQIWKRDFLIYNSSLDLTIEKPEFSGFKNIKVENDKWRSFCLYDQESDITVQVIESSNIRNELIGKILLTLILPLILSFIPILIIIWFVVSRSLMKLTNLSNEIKNISPSLLMPFENSQDLPIEVRPLVESLNSLLLKLDESLNKEREFINFASHEIRTPLSVIKTKTQFLIKKYQDNDKLRNDLNNLEDAVDRIINLSNQLLTLSRLESENKLIEKESFNLPTLINQTLQEFDKDIQGKKIKIDSSIQNNITITANKYYLIILLNNIISNSIKYSPNAETIQIKLASNDNSIVLSVINKGEEIAKSELQQLFHRFYRTKKNNQSGSGLGLAIVKKIVDLHNGEVNFTSTNQQNSITITLPIYNGDEYLEY